MLYPCAVVATKLSFAGTDLRVCPILVEASSRAEALGKAEMVKHKVYPAADGWHNQSAIVGSLKSVVDPADPIEISGLERA